MYLILDCKLEAKLIHRNLFAIEVNLDRRLHAANLRLIGGPVIDLYQSQLC